MGNELSTGITHSQHLTINNMTITRSLYHCLGSTLSLSAVPVLATFAVGVKLFSFAPLLIKWNFPLSEIPGPAFVLLPLLDVFRPEGPELTREHLDAVSQEFGELMQMRPEVTPH